MTNYNGGVAAFKSGQGLDSKGLPGGDGGYVNVDMSRTGAPLYQTTSQYLGAFVSLKSHYDKTAPLRPRTRTWAPCQAVISTACTALIWVSARARSRRFNRFWR